ncbi:hypothetical protein PI125_g18884 [Phytophthora idaei]|nr:hypothetical protein PI125_g18884 [Phytophthora idaei]
MTPEEWRDALEQCQLLHEEQVEKCKIFDMEELAKQEILHEQ